MSMLSNLKEKIGTPSQWYSDLTRTAVWKSVFRHKLPNDPKNRALVVLTNVFLHLHPVRMRKQGLRVSYTWCMGGISFFLFLSLTVTGILLMFYYRPTAQHAYPDMLDLMESASLGIMREMHRWAAHLMIITVWLHMLRVFLTGSYKPPREFNWVVGVLLLVLTLLFSFTGYLLPWDQLAMWAVTVGSNMARATPVVGTEGPGMQLMQIGDVPLITAGSDARFVLLAGRFVGEGALLRFYVLHCLGIPFIFVILLAVHFWRVRRDGGISGPGKGGKLAL
jgi:quinol-cytochrome oxidoreductase complex cytochrome b subunit